MLNFTLAFIVLIHGLIHLLGFTHQLQLTEREEHPAQNFAYSKRVEKVLSILWIITYALFLTTMILLMVPHHTWWIAALTGVVLSQILIILDWYEAKYGTIGNIIVVLAIIAAYGGGMLS